MSPQGSSIEKEYQMQYHWLIIAGAWLLTHLAEYRNHRKNREYLKVCGGKERHQTLTKTYYWLNYGIFPFALFEAYLTGGIKFGPFTYLATMTIVAMVFFRTWAIYSLGGYWSMSCIQNPRWPLVRKGPYRWMRHPEYLSRLVEGLSITLIFNAWIVAIGFAVASMALLHKLTPLEREQLLEVPIG
jgi:methyltransferase